MSGYIRCTECDSSVSTEQIEDMEILNDRAIFKCPVCGKIVISRIFK